MHIILRTGCQPTRLVWDARYGHKQVLVLPERGHGNEWLTAWRTGL